MQREVLLRKIGENIVRIRSERSMTQTELGKRIGQPRSNMNRLEKGNQNPSILLLQEIADVLGVPVKDLVDFETGSNS